MEKTPPNYLILYALIVIPLAVSFFFIRRSPKTPAQLNLADQASNKPPQHLKNELVAANPRRAYYEERVREARREMNLNVLFNWNGFTWDAYEVLGVPPGSSKEAVATAYQKARAQCDADSMKFFEAAYTAINRSTTART